MQFGHESASQRLDQSAIQLIARTSHPRNSHRRCSLTHSLRVHKSNGQLESLIRRRFDTIRPLNMHQSASGEMKSYKSRSRQSLIAHLIWIWAWSHLQYIPKEEEEEEEQQFNWPHTAALAASTWHVLQSLGQVNYTPSNTDECRLRCLPGQQQQQGSDGWERALDERKFIIITHSNIHPHPLTLSLSSWLRA